MIEDLPPCLAEVIKEPQRNFLIKSLGQAYLTSIDCHDEARGSNEVTFGLGVHTHAKHEFTKPLDDEFSVRPFEIKNSKVFEMKIQDFSFAYYRVGKKASQDIRTSFPGNLDGPKRMVDEQLWLPGMKPEESLEKARKFVIAHMGNKDTGLEALYLCVPKMNREGDIIDWAFTFPLWKRTHETPPPSKMSPENYTPEEKINDQIQLRKKNNKLRIFKE